MTRMIKDYIAVAEHESLDTLIARLAEIRDKLPDGTNAEVTIRGDAVFGRQLCVGFMRPLTSEEAAVEGRYGDFDVPRKRRAA